MMQRLFEQLIQFVQQGIGAIFRFVQFIWIWSVGQFTTLLQVPWQDWPLQKRGLLLLAIGIIVWVLFYAAKELWAAGQTLLVAFGTLISALVRTLPKVLFAGLIALASAWLLNNLDLSRIYPPEYRYPGLEGR